MYIETIVLVPFPWVPVPYDMYPTDNYLNKTTHIMKWTPPLKFKEVAYRTITEEKNHFMWVKQCQRSFFSELEKI